MSKDIITRTSDATYDKLEFLRKNAGLNYIEMGKVRKARRDADKFLKRYRKIENDGSGVDYSKANAIEYELMLRKWEEICKPDLEFLGNEQQSLSEFAKERMYVGLKDELNQKPNKKCLDFRNISSVQEWEHLRTQRIIPAVIGPVTDEQYDQYFQKNISGLIYDYKDGYCFYRGRYEDNVTSVMDPENRDKKYIISTIFNEYGEKVQIEGTTYSVEEHDVLYITDADKKYSLSEQQKLMMNKKKQEESIRNVQQPVGSNDLTSPKLNLEEEQGPVIK